jgi:hypothetical protein
MLTMITCTYSSLSRSNREVCLTREFKKILNHKNIIGSDEQLCPLTVTLILVHYYPPYRETLSTCNSVTDLTPILSLR